MIETTGLKLREALKKTIERLRTRRADILDFMKQHTGHPDCPATTQARLAMTGINLEEFRLLAMQEILEPQKVYRLSMKTFTQEYATSQFDGLSLPPAAPCPASAGALTAKSPKPHAN